MPPKSLTMLKNGNQVPNLILINRFGDIETKPALSSGVFNIMNLYKLCGFRKFDHFELRYTWRVNGSKNQYFTLFAKSEGKADTMNLYELPNVLESKKKRFYGTMCIVYSNSNSLDSTTIQDLTVEKWNEIKSSLIEDIEDKSSSQPLPISPLTFTPIRMTIDMSVNPSDSVRTEQGFISSKVVGKVENKSTNSTAIGVSAAASSSNSKISSEIAVKDSDDEDDEDDEENIKRPTEFISDDEDDEDEDEDEDDEDEYGEEGDLESEMNAEELLQEEKTKKFIASSLYSDDNVSSNPQTNSSGGISTNTESNSTQKRGGGGISLQSKSAKKLMGNGMGVGIMNPKNSKSKGANKKTKGKSKGKTPAKGKKSKANSDDVSDVDDGDIGDDADEYYEDDDNESADYGDDDMIYENIMNGMKKKANSGAGGNEIGEMESFYASKIFDIEPELEEEKYEY